MDYFAWFLLGIILVVAAIMFILFVPDEGLEDGEDDDKIIK